MTLQSIDVINQDRKTTMDMGCLSEPLKRLKRYLQLFSNCHHHQYLHRHHNRRCHHRHHHPLIEAKKNQPWMLRVLFWHYRIRWCYLLFFGQNDIFVTDGYSWRLLPRIKERKEKKKKEGERKKQLTVDILKSTSEVLQSQRCKKARQWSLERWRQCQKPSF